MRISVVIPAYNEEKYIGACLEAMVNQEEKADEIIVVNNNSTDRTVEIAKQYPVIIVNEQEQGMIQARNRGFNEAQYEIIARTDADTIVPSNWIKKIKEDFLSEALVALSGPSYFYETPAHLSSKTVYNLHKPYFRIMRQVLRHDCLYGPNIALRKSAWEQIKNQVCLNNNDIHEDIDLAIHIAPLGLIKFDKTLIVNSSFRRFKRFQPYLEYPHRLISSIRNHKQFTMRAQGTKLIKRIVARTFIKDML